MNDECITQLSRNKYLVRVVMIEARTGRRVNRKVTVRGSKQDARNAREALRAELSATGDRPAKVRLSEFAASWLERRAVKLKPSVLLKYGTSLSHIIPALGDLYLDCVLPSDVEAYVSRRITQGGAGYTVLNELRLLRTIAKAAQADRLCPAYFCHGVKPPEVNSYTEDNPNLLTARQFGALWAEVVPEQKVLVALLVTTGLRWGEVSALTWGDVDLAKHEITIRRSNFRGEFVTPKTRSSRRKVPMLPVIVTALGEPGSVNALIFPSKFGSLHKSVPLRAVLDRAWRAANTKLKDPEKIPRITTHGLRRTFNNLARQLTTGEVLRSLTGHATEEMSYHYSIVSSGERAAVSHQIAGMTFGATPGSALPTSVASRTAPRALAAAPEPASSVLPMSSDFDHLF